MQSSTALIDSFIKIIGESSLLNENCQAIRAYEGTNLPVPIKKTYFSFSASESSLYLSADANGNKTEVNSIKISVNCFVPLFLSPAIIHNLAETVMLVLMNSNKSITGFTVGKTVYDKDVDAFRIGCEIRYQTEKQV